MKGLSTKALVFMSLMAALNIVLTRFLSIPIGETIRIGFGSVPIIFTGAILGPIPAMCVAFVGDFVGCVFFSSLSWFPPLTLGPMVLGFWCGVCRKQLLEARFPEVLLICMAGTALASMLCTTYGLSLLTGKGFWALFVSRAPVQLLTGLVNTATIYALLKSPAIRLIRPEAGK